MSLDVIHIVDDDASLRDALAALFRSVDRDVRCFASVQEFLDWPACRVASGCIIVDVRLPGMSGLDFQAKLYELGISMPAIVMTGFGDIPMSVRAMKAGAIDFLSKPFRDQDILDAVSVAFERDRQRRNLEENAKSLRDRFAKLTEREAQVMALVVAGRMNKQIAHELTLSEITVKIHRGSMMRKMQARSLADLVKLGEALRSSAVQLTRPDGSVKP